MERLWSKALTTFSYQRQGDIHNSGHSRIALIVMQSSIVKFKLIYRTWPYHSYVLFICDKYENPNIFSQFQIHCLCGANHHHLTTPLYIFFMHFLTHYSGVMVYVYCFYTYKQATKGMVRNPCVYRLNPNPLAFLYQ